MVPHGVDQYNVRRACDKSSPNYKVVGAEMASAETTSRPKLFASDFAKQKEKKKTAIFSQCMSSINAKNKKFFKNCA